MPALHSAAVALAILGVTTALPAEQKGIPAFSVDAIRNPNYRPLSGTEAYLKALKKFGSREDVEAFSKTAESLAAVTPVPATPVGGEYTTPVTIGGQVYKLDFDTGSSDLWVLDSSLNKNIGDHTYYKAGSTGKLVDGATWNITYADGSGAHGIVYTDTVKIGGATVTGQAVEAATSASVSMDGYDPSPDDGLLGLGFDNINTIQPTKAKTFFSNAIEQGLPKALFTVNLKNDSSGSYTFGAIDSTQYKGAITYSDVDPAKGYWTFTPTGYSIGGKPGTSGASITGIVDTGTTIIYVPDVIATEYWKNVPGSSYAGLFGGYTFDCSANLPDFTLNINGYNATVPGANLNYGVVITGGSICLGALAPSGKIPFAVYGDSFLKTQFVVFDRSQATPRMGFANKA